MTKLNRLLGQRFKVWLLAGVILLALGGAVIAYQTNETAQAPEPQWLRVEARPMVLRLGLVGRLEPASLITFTAPFDGTVEEKITEEGQRVKRGQVLLRLDPAVHEALARWASDDLRSVNAQIEMILRRALEEHGRTPRGARPIPKRGRPPTA